MRFRTLSTLLTIGTLAIGACASEAEPGTGTGTGAGRAGSSGNSQPSSAGAAGMSARAGTGGAAESETSLGGEASEGGSSGSKAAIAGSSGTSSNSGSGSGGTGEVIGGGAAADVAGAAGENGGAAGETGGASARPLTVVVLGASTAAGKNLDQTMYGGRPGGLADSWPSRYEVYLASARPGSRLVNLAKPGYSSYQALPTGTVNPSGYPAVDTARNVTAALNEQPDVVIVAFPGGAELGLGASVSDIVHNFQTIADVAAQGGAKTWFASTQPHLDQTPAQTTTGLGLRDAVLAEFGSQALPDDNGDPALLLSDGTHPNASGHAALFDVVVAADIPAAISSR
jgi:acyl-CoA thioesterase-1